MVGIITTKFQDFAGGTNLFSPSRNVICFWFTILVCKYSFHDSHLTLSNMIVFTPWFRESIWGAYWVFLNCSVFCAFWNWGNNNGMCSENCCACWELESSQNSTHHLISIALALTVDLRVILALQRLASVQSQGSIISPKSDYFLFLIHNHPGIWL